MRMIIIIVTNSYDYIKNHKKENLIEVNLSHSVWRETYFSVRMEQIEKTKCSKGGFTMHIRGMYDARTHLMKSSTVTRRYVERIQKGSSVRKLESLKSGIFNDPGIHSIRNMKENQLHYTNKV